MAASRRSRKSGSAPTPNFRAKFPPSNGTLRAGVIPPASLAAIGAPMFSISTFLNSFEPLFWAARYTLLISGLGIALGLVVGALICAAALSRMAWLRWFAALWVSFLRGVPLLVQLLLCYYLLPVIGINVPALVAAVMTVGICSSAYVSEIWRGAIIALPNGQAEAATAIG